MYIAATIFIIVVVICFAVYRNETPYDEYIQIEKIIESEKTSFYKNNFTRTNFIDWEEKNSHERDY